MQFENRRTIDGDNYAAEIVGKDNSGRVVVSGSTIKGVNAAGLSKRNRVNSTQTLTLDPKIAQQLVTFEVRNYFVDTVGGVDITFFSCNRDHKEAHGYERKTGCLVAGTIGKNTPTVRGKFTTMQLNKPTKNIAPKVSGPISMGSGCGQHSVNGWVETKCP